MALELLDLVGVAGLSGKIFFELFGDGRCCNEIARILQSASVIAGNDTLETAVTTKPIVSGLTRI